MATDLAGVHSRHWRDLLPPAHLTAHPPYVGINVALEQYNDSEQRRVLARLREQGFGWVRQRLDWGALEPQPGHYRWNLSDRLINGITDSLLAPVIVLDGSPAWARAAQDVEPSVNSFAPPADPATFARFASAFAQRYGDRVRFYQVWDEPNIAPHWGHHHIDPVGYAHLLKAASRAIRATDPDALILLAALAPTTDRGHTAIDEIYFLQRLYAAGVAPFFDIVAVQPFGFGSGPEDARQQPDVLNFQRVGLLRRVMVAAGDEAKPMWAVRFGWNRQRNSPWRTVSPENQMRFAGRAVHLVQQQWPWLVAMGWVIDQPDAPPGDPAWGFAMTDELAQAIVKCGMQSAECGRRKTEDGTWRAGWVQLMLLGFLGVMTGWRGWAAARLLPWSAWRMSYLQGSEWRRWSIWGGLIALYFVATWPPLLVLCWLVAALFICWQPRVGVLLAAVLLPFHIYHKELRWGDLTLLVPPAQALVFCLVPTLVAGAHAAWRHLWSRPQGDKWLHCSPTTYGLALGWLAVGLLSAANVWYWPAYWTGFTDLVGVPLLLFAAIRTQCQPDKARAQVATALLAGGLLAALIGLFVWLRGGGTDADGVQRLVGPHFSPNHTALYLVRTLFLGVGIWGLKQWRFGNWGLIAIGVVGVALLFTASRGAWLLGVPMGLMVLGMRPPLHRQNVLKYARGHRWLSGGVWLSALLILASSAWFFGARLGNSGTVIQRLEIWQATLRMWQDYPLFGVGMGGFFWRFGGYILPGTTIDHNLLHPHNVWLEFVSLGGVIGVIWLIGAILVMMRLRWWSGGAVEPWGDGIAVGVLAGLAAGFAHGQADAFAVLPDLAAWNWAALALLLPRPSSGTFESFSEKEEEQEQEKVSYEL